MEVISGISKCSICKCEIIQDIVLFVDEAGYVRTAHTTCFTEKYEEVNDVVRSK